MLMFSRGAEVHRCRDAEAQRRFRKVHSRRCRVQGAGVALDAEQVQWCRGGAEE